MEKQISWTVQDLIDALKGIENKELQILINDQDDFNIWVTDYYVNLCKY